MKRQLLSFGLVLAALLSACSPAATPVPPTVTQTPLPSNTPSPSPEPTPTSTLTPMPTATPDMRVIDMNPREMIIHRTDLPKEGKFILVYEKPMRNAEIASAWSIEKGSEYLEESGRIDGWETEWDRTVRSARAPEYVVIEAILFKTAAGPKYARDAWGGPCQPDRISDITLLKEDLGLGDASSLCVKRTMQSTGDYYIEYDLTVNYRNVEMMFWIGGLEKDFDQDFAEEIARLQYAKLAELPLSDTVSWAP